MASELTIRCDNRLSAVRSVSSPPAIGLSSEAMPVLCTLSAALNTGATVWLVARPVAVETGDALFACQLSQVGATLVYSGSLSPSTVAAVAHLGREASAEITVELVEVWTASGTTHRRTLAMFGTTILRSVYGGTYSDETIAQALTAVTDCAAYADTITGLVAVEQAARIAGDEQLYDAISLLTGNAQRFVTDNSSQVLDGLTTYESTDTNTGGSTVTLTIASTGHIYWRGIAALATGTTPAQTVNLRIIANEVLSGAYRGDMRLAMRMGVYDASSGTVSWVSTYGTAQTVPKTASPLLLPTLIPELTANVGDMLIVDLACTLATGGTARNVALSIEDDTLSAWAFNPGTVTVNVASKMDKTPGAAGELLDTDAQGNARRSGLTTAAVAAGINALEWKLDRLGPPLGAGMVVGTDGSGGIVATEIDAASLWTIPEGFDSSWMDKLIAINGDGRQVNTGIFYPDVLTALSTTLPAKMDKKPGFAGSILDTDGEGNARRSGLTTAAVSTALSTTLPSKMDKTPGAAGELLDTDAQGNARRSGVTTAAVSTALIQAAGAVRHDTAQALSDAAKVQALVNIGAPSIGLNKAAMYLQDECYPWWVSYTGAITSYSPNSLSLFGATTSAWSIVLSSKSIGAFAGYIYYGSFYFSMPQCADGSEIEIVLVLYDGTTLATGTLVRDSGSWTFDGTALSSVSNIISVDCRTSSTSARITVGEVSKDYTVTNRPEKIIVRRKTGNSASNNGMLRSFYPKYGFTSTNLTF